ncbi:MAG: DNA-3-methyladenine glycosylase I [Fimbriimonadaceae bacterium]
MTRCDWAKEPPETLYHDAEWGVPTRAEQHVFEHLCLEAAQCGLSWRLVLLRRESYRKAFHGFDIERVAAIEDEELEHILTSSGIIRNRAKAKAVRNNARVLLGSRSQVPCLGSWMWKFVGDVPQVNRWNRMSEVPAFTETSIAMSKELKRLGFSFVGPTTIYAHMQACGMVNDHLVSCFRHSEVSSHG